MNTENTFSPDELEAHEVRILAVLLGESSAAETAAVETLLAAYPVLQALRARLSLTIGLLRDTARVRTNEKAPAQLSPERREALLAVLSKKTTASPASKTVSERSVGVSPAVSESLSVRPRKSISFRQVLLHPYVGWSGLAACLFLGVAISIPSFNRVRSDMPRAYEVEEPREFSAPGSRGPTFWLDTVTGDRLPEDSPYVVAEKFKKQHQSKSQSELSSGIGFFRGEEGLKSETSNGSDSLAKNREGASQVATPAAGATVEKSLWHTVRNDNETDGKKTRVFDMDKELKPTSNFDVTSPVTVNGNVYFSNDETKASGGQQSSNRADSNLALNGGSFNDTTVSGANTYRDTTNTNTYSGATTITAGKITTVSGGFATPTAEQEGAASLRGLSTPAAAPDVTFHNDAFATPAPAANPSSATNETKAAIEQRQRSGGGGRPPKVAVEVDRLTPLPEGIVTAGTGAPPSELTKSSGLRSRGAGLGVGDGDGDGQGPGSSFGKGGGSGSVKGLAGPPPPASPVPPAPSKPASRPAATPPADSFKPTDAPVGEKTKSDRQMAEGGLNSFKESPPAPGSEPMAGSKSAPGAVLNGKLGSRGSGRGLGDGDGNGVGSDLGVVSPMPSEAPANSPAPPSGLTRSGGGTLTLGDTLSDSVASDSTFRVAEAYALVASDREKQREKGQSSGGDGQPAKGADNRRKSAQSEMTVDPFSAPDPALQEESDGKDALKGLGANRFDSRNGQNSDLITQEFGGFLKAGESGARKSSVTGYSEKGHKDYVSDSDRYADPFAGEGKKRESQQDKSADRDANLRANLEMTVTEKSLSDEDVAESKKSVDAKAPILGDILVTGRLFNEKKENKPAEEMQKKKEAEVEPSVDYFSPPLSKEEADEQKRIELQRLAQSKANNTYTAELEKAKKLAPSEADLLAKSKLESIQIEEINFRGIPVSRALKILSEASVKSDTKLLGGKRGVELNVFDTSGEDPTVNITLRDLPLNRMLEFVAEQVGMDLTTLNGRVGLAPNYDKLIPAKAALPPEDISRPLATLDNAFSTFALNVSDASFRLTRDALSQGTWDATKIRSEEFYNAFSYRDPAPQTPIGLSQQTAAHPFTPGQMLVRLGVQTQAQGRAPQQPLHLTVLLDSSGSMERPDRRDAALAALRGLSNNLGPQDTISLVSFSAVPRLWLDHIPGDQAAQVAATAAQFPAEGGTNLEAALEAGYEQAEKQLKPGSKNAVILLTDGSANLGNADANSLADLVTVNRQRGIAFHAYGVGSSDLNDATLERLARNGDGRYAVLSTPEEAESQMVGPLAGSFRPAALDVKVQVEWNSRRVKAHRLVGFAERRLTKEQFRDNTVDGGELAAAASGNALYSVETIPDGDGPLGTVRVRYRDPATDTYRELSWPVAYDSGAPSFGDAPRGLRLAGVAALLAERLQGQPAAQDTVLADLRKIADQLAGEDTGDAAVPALAEMVRQAEALLSNR